MKRNPRKIKKNEGSIIGKEKDDIFKYILLSAVLLTIAMFLLISNKPIERYSQLSLMESTLPDSVDVGTRFTFGFEILNREGGNGVYEYSVLLDGEEINSKKIVVEDQERKTVFENALIREVGEHRIDVKAESLGKSYNVFFKIDVV